MDLVVLLCIVFDSGYQTNMVVTAQKTIGLKVLTALL